jgi:hypothetical protein
MADRWPRTRVPQPADMARPRAKRLVREVLPWGRCPGETRGAERIWRSANDSSKGIGPDTSGSWLAFPLSSPR